MVDQATVVPLPLNAIPSDVAALVSTMLPSWIALRDHGSISESTTVLVHDASSRACFHIPPNL